MMSRANPNVGACVHDLVATDQPSIPSDYIHVGQLCVSCGAAYQVHEITWPRNIFFKLPFHALLLVYVHVQTVLFP